MHTLSPKVSQTRRARRAKRFRDAFLSWCIRFAYLQFLSAHGHIIPDVAVKKYYVVWTNVSFDETAFVTALLADPLSLAYDTQ